jgi:Flp pilus assembly protein TadG
VRLPRGDRGSFTFAVIFWALMTMMIAGLVVDGGLAITERQTAGDVAEQAARAAANDLDQGALRGGVVAIDPGASCNAAKNLVNESVTAQHTVSCAGPFTSTVNGVAGVSGITVIVTIQYAPILIGMFYEPPGPGHTFTATASATAYAEAGD